MVPILTSHRRRLLQSPVVSLLPHLHEFLFQFPEQNIYWNIAPLRSARILLSNESLFTQNWFRTRELCPFYPSAAICSEFQNAQRPKFFAISPCTGLQIHWYWMRWNGNFMELLNIIFFFLVHLCPYAKFDENSGACSQTLEMLTNLISSLITNSWECFVMPAKQSSAHTTPGVTVGSRYKCQQTKNIPWDT